MGCRSCIQLWRSSWQFGDHWTIERMKRFGVDRLGMLAKGVAENLSDELDYKSPRHKRTENSKHIF